MIFFQPLYQPTQSLKRANTKKIILKEKVQNEEQNI